MRKILAIALSILLISAGAYAQPAATTPAPASTQEDAAGAVYDLYDFAGGETMQLSDPYWVQFEGLFQIKMPALWQNFALSDAQAGNGMIACFGDGTHFLFVGRAEDTGVYADMTEFAMTVALDDSNVMVENYVFNGTTFTCYADYENASSDCATIIPGKGIYTFYFYPMDGNAEFAQTVLDLMNSYTAIEAQ